MSTIACMSGAALLICQKTALESEYALAAQADLILSVSEPLADRLASQHGANRVICVPNGCDYDFFASYAQPCSHKAEATIIGYTGTIREWFDWDAVLAIAVAYPAATIELVEPAECIPSNLPRNVKLLGPKPYEDMPGHVASFDVCIIPFRDANGAPLVAAVSPIKLYEYLACGKPVVSSSMPDTRRLAEKGVVHLADSPDTYVAEIAETLVLARDPALIGRRQDIARGNSWTSRWQQVEHGIRQSMVARAV